MKVVAQATNQISEKGSGSGCRNGGCLERNNARQFHAYMDMSEYLAEIRRAEFRVCLQRPGGQETAGQHSTVEVKAMEKMVPVAPFPEPTPNRDQEPGTYHVPTRLPSSPPARQLTDRSRSIFPLFAALEKGAWYYPLLCCGECCKLQVPSHLVLPATLLEVDDPEPKHGTAVNTATLRRHYDRLRASCDSNPFMNVTGKLERANKCWLPCL